MRSAVRNAGDRAAGNDTAHDAQWKVMRRMAYGAIFTHVRTCMHNNMRVMNMHTHVLNSARRMHTLKLACL